MAYITSCSFCGSILRPVIDLGMHPHSDYFPKDCKSEIKLYPLSLARCTSCGLFQNDYHLATLDMFNDDYLYDSSVNTSARKHWRNFSVDLRNRIIDKVISTDCLSALDVGSNAGELLFYLESEGFAAEGIEPSKMPHGIAISRGLKSHNAIFSRECLRSLSRESYSLVTFTNSFPHIPQPVATLTLASEIIDRDIGIICIESPSAQSMLKEGQYDQIYHQHMTYLDIFPIYSICKQMGLRLFDFKSSTFHNGSCRYYIVHQDSIHQNTLNMNEYLDNFVIGDYLSDQMESSFREKSLKHRKDLRRFVQSSQDLDHVLSIVSAPAKGNTILNFCGITSNDIAYASEANKLKIGRYTPLSSIPIVSDRELREYKPDILIVMAWNFFDQISSVISNLFPSATIINPFSLPTFHD